MSARDAKVYAMIDDLNRGAMADLMGLPPDEEHSELGLRTMLRAKYESDEISGDDIIAAWNEEEAEFE